MILRQLLISLSVLFASPKLSSHSVLALIQTIKSTSSQFCAARAKFTHQSPNMHTEHDLRIEIRTIISLLEVTARGWGHEIAFIGGWASSRDPSGYSA